MHYLSLDTSPRLTAFILFVGAASAPLTYVLAKRLFDEDVAKIAGLLAAFAPALLHFGATSADAVYLTLGLLAAIPLLRQRSGSARSRSPSSACSPGRCWRSPRGRRSSSGPATASSPRSGSA